MDGDQGAVARRSAVAHARSINGGFPAQKVAYASGVESAFIDGEVLAAAGQNGMAWPGHPAVTQIQRQMADAVNMAMSGALSPQEALDQAAAEVDEILEDY